jgi:sec-independent protein translocase protein TatA
MLGLRLPEILVILFIVILIFGAKRLPELATGLGKGIRNFKDASRGGDDSDKA